MTETPTPDQVPGAHRAADHPTRLDDADRLDIAGHYQRAQDWTATAEDEHRAGCHSRSANAAKVAQSHARLAELGHTLGIGRPRRPRPRRGGGVVADTIVETSPAGDGEQPDPPTPPAAGAAAQMIAEQDRRAIAAASTVGARPHQLHEDDVDAIRRATAAYDAAPAARGPSPLDMARRSHR